MSEQMEDSDLMPFGKHKGDRLDQVPARYLLWLDEQPGFRKRTPTLAEYIRRNRSVLEKEIEEGRG